MEEPVKQSSMDFSRRASDMSLLERAELDILAGFCANPYRYQELQKDYSVAYQRHVLKLIEYKFACNDEKARKIMNQNGTLSEERQKKLDRCFQEAKPLAHAEIDKKNVAMARRIARIWYEGLEQ